jgi:hypothetical protein
VDEESPKELSWAIISAFAADLAELNKVREHLGQNSFVARTFVRTLFSMFDGYSWFLKHRAMDGAANARVQFTEKELEVINEERSKSLDDGTSKMLPKIVATKENLLFSIRAYARVRQVDAPLVSNALPPEFHIANDVRNRITHPKSAADFAISANELRAIGMLLGLVRESCDMGHERRTKDDQRID